MAGRNIEDLRRALQALHTEATETKSVFTELQYIIDSIKFNELKTTAVGLKQANAELERFLNTLRQVASASSSPAQAGKRVESVAAAAQTMQAGGMPASQVAQTLEQGLKLRSEAIKALSSGDTAAWEKAKAALDAYVVSLKTLLQEKQKVLATDPTGGVEQKKDERSTETINQEKAFRDAIGMTGKAGQTAEKFLDKYNMKIGRASCRERV